MSVVNGAPDPFFTGLHKCRYHFTEEQRRDFCDKVLAIGNAIVDIHISVFAHLDLPIFAKSSNIRFYSSSLAPTFTITAFSTYYYYQQIGFYKNVRACIYHRSSGNFGVKNPDFLFYKLQWQQLHKGWHLVRPSTMHLHPPEVSPRPCKARKYFWELFLTALSEEFLHQVPNGAAQ